MNVFDRMKWALSAMVNELALSPDKRKSDLWTHFVDGCYVKSHAGKHLENAFHGVWYNETRLLCAQEGEHQPVLNPHVEPRHDDAKLVRVFNERTIHAVVSDMHKNMPVMKGSVEESEFKKKKSRFINILRSFFGSMVLSARAYVECVIKTTVWMQRDDATKALHEQLEDEATHNILKRSLKIAS
jgi:hypothetical protein